MVSSFRVVEHQEVAGTLGRLVDEKFGPSIRGVGVDAGELVNASDALQCSHIKGVYPDDMAGMARFISRSPSSPYA